MTHPPTYLLTDRTKSRDAIASKNLVWYNYCFGVSQYCKKNLKLLPQTSQTELIPVVKFVEKDLRSVEVRIILLTNTWFFNSCFIAE